MAIAALVTGVLGLVPLGLVFGFTALSQIRRSGEQGRGVAVAGIGVSALWLLLVLPIGAILLLAGGDGAGTPRSRVVASDELQVGDCIQDDPIGSGTDEAEAAAEVTVVPCGGPHYAEVYAAFTFPTAAYPGRDLVISEVERTCRRDFAPFVGVDYENSTLDVSYLYPRASEWYRDKDAVCMVYDPSGGAPGSLRGSRR
jgi:hypothetical protein